MTELYAAAACLVAAQVLGLYGLKTRKADLVFAVCMVGLLIAGGILGVSGALHKL
ncbi:MAG: hypothetical protein M3Y91_04485 [Actinomycetota bacterium]|nr:hypothetical protein [Actinomycetota bacterium]